MSALPVLFVGDGDRDAVSVPRLAEQALERDIREDCENWARLHGVSGYDRKLRYAVRQAKSRGRAGVVATLDRDKSKKGSRLSALTTARDLDKQQEAAFPIAVGEAVPYGEAWLLSDDVAVREALGLDSSAEIPWPDAKNTSPKEALHELLASSPAPDRRPLEVWADIARMTSFDRCRKAKETGLHAFVEDLRREFALPVKRG